MTATEQHMALARAEAGCPDDETLVMHCRELRADLDAERTARRALAAAAKELAEIVEAVREHDATIDCFTTQPVQAALALAAKLP